MLITRVADGSVGKEKKKAPVPALLDYNDSRVNFGNDLNAVAAGVVNEIGVKTKDRTFVHGEKTFKETNSSTKKREVLAE